MIKRPILLVLLLLMLPVISSAVIPDNPDFLAPPDSSELLFYIHRNKNPNTIVYHANFNKATRQFDSNEPVDVFWIKYDEDPSGKRKDINYIESVLAYGVNVQEQSEANDKVVMNLVSYKKQSFELYIDEDGHARALFPINGKPAIFERAFVQAKETFLLPQVAYVELFGYDLITKEPVYEKFTP